MKFIQFRKNKLKLYKYFMSDILTVYLVLIGVFSIIIGGLESLILFFLSSKLFISPEIKRIWKNLFLSLFFLFVYFFSYFFSILFPEIQKNFYVVLFQLLLSILSIFFLLYTSLLVYNFALELGFHSPKMKRKLKKFLEK